MNSENKDTQYAPIDLQILLHDFLRAARRMALAGILLAVALTGLFCWKAKRDYTPSYTASATFTVNVGSGLVNRNRGYSTATADQMAKTFPYILTSGALKETVMRDLGVSWLPAIRASVLSNTNIFTLTVTAGDPQLASNVLQSVIVHYPDVAEFVVGPTTMTLLDESGLPQSPDNAFSYRGAIKKGVVLSVGLWLMVVLAVSLLRSTVHNEEELKKLLNVRCIGTMPKTRRQGRGKNEVCPTVETVRSNGFSEAVRLLRVRVERGMEELGEKNVLLVSSAVPGEGKTTTAINLASALAARGKKTLLIDCDLRNPSVGKNLGLSNAAGLVDVLTGKKSMETVTQTLKDSGLRVICAGSAVKNAADLLARDECYKAILACRDRYDYIILDTPPSSLLVDATEIAAVADAALLVIRQDYAAKAQIVEGAQALARSGLPLIGCVMNQATGRMLSSYSSYYGYGYGYGGKGGRHYKEYQSSAKN